MDNPSSHSSIPQFEASTSTRARFSIRLSHLFLRTGFALVFACTAAYAQSGHSLFKSAYPGCGTMTKAFKPGETLNYKLYYHWHFVWLQTGKASVTTTLRDFYGVPCYYISALGQTLPKYDWFYKIRDTLTTLTDTNDFSTMRFYRSTHEAAVDVRNDNVFDNKKHVVYYLNEGKKYRRDSASIPAGTIDILTGVYFTRCINFGCVGTKDTILLNIYLDGHVYNVHLRYLGKEVVSSSFGRYMCEKLSVELIAGTIFREGAKMFVWATDDANHLPLLMEAPLIIGSVRAELESFSNLRNTMEEKVK